MGLKEETIEELIERMKLGEGPFDPFVGLGPNFRNKLFLLGVLTGKVREKEYISSGKRYDTPIADQLERICADMSELVDALEKEFGFAGSKLGFKKESDNAT